MHTCAFRKDEEAQRDARHRFVSRLAATLRKPLAFRSARGRSRGILTAVGAPRARQWRRTAHGSVSVLRLCVSVRRALIYVVRAVEGEAAAPAVGGGGGVGASCARSERVRLACVRVALAFSLPFLRTCARARALDRDSVSLALLSVALSVSLARARSLARSLARSYARPPVRRLARARAR